MVNIKLDNELKNLGCLSVCCLNSSTHFLIPVCHFSFFIALLSLSKECPEKCGIAYDPVCASNGKTYKNMCRLERENCFAETKIVELYKGECLKSEEDEIEEERR